MSVVIQPHTGHVFTLSRYCQEATVLPVVTAGSFHHKVAPLSLGMAPSMSAAAMRCTWYCHL